MDTHGPRIAAIDFSVIAADPSLAGSLATGTIQAAEWTFTVGSYDTLAASVNVGEAKTSGYTFEGVVFNTVQPIINSLYYREAIQLLTAYTGTVSIDTTILQSDLAGEATSDLMPCNFGSSPIYAMSPLYSSTSACTAAQVAAHIIASSTGVPYGWSSVPETNYEHAAEDLASITGNTAPTYNPTGDYNLQGISCIGVVITKPTPCTNEVLTPALISSFTTSEAKDYLPIAHWYAYNTFPSSGDNCINTPASCTAFSPNLQYRSDDPLRSGFAVLLVATASNVGLSIAATGITDEEADTIVYGDASAVLTADGGYCSSNSNATYPLGTTPSMEGTNNCPTVTLGPSSNSLTITPSTLAVDYWDMYTYGWVASSGLVFQGGEWINSQFLTDEINTGGLVSGATSQGPTSCDYYENLMMYATTLLASEQATVQSEICSAQNLPGIVGYFENYLYADYINGWIGYAGEPTTGPNTVGGMYYTSLNVRPYNMQFEVGGTLSYALHGPAAASDALNPLYSTNWVWQADVWSEFYDAPLETPGTTLTSFSTPGAYIPWMLSGSTPTAPGCSGAGNSCGTVSDPTVGGGVQNVTFEYGASNSPTVLAAHTNYNTLPTTGLFCIQNTTVMSDCGLTIPQKSEEITFTFDQNMTFTDGYPITAYDYNYSLWALDVAGNLNLLLAADYTPFAGAVMGPFGLLGVIVNNPYSITMIMGNDAYWNIVNLDYPVLPQHIFQYIDVYNAFAFHASIDLSSSYAADYITDPAWFASGSGTGVKAGYCDAGQTYPTCPIANLANLEVSTGPFYLYDYDYSVNPNAGVMLANLNYYRTAWYDAVTLNEVGPFVGSGATQHDTGSITFDAYPAQFIAEPPATPDFLNVTTAGPFSAISCSVTITKYTGAPPLATTNRWKTGLGPLLATSSPTLQPKKPSLWAQTITASTSSPTAGITFAGCGTADQVSVTINGLTLVSPNQLAPNDDYKVTFIMTYTYNGATYYWYQYYGFYTSATGTSITLGTPSD